MSGGKHTAGPWEAESRSYDETWDIKDADGQHIASVPNPFEHLGDRPDLVADLADETEANARLIASAPDLLAILIDLVEAGSDASAEAYDQARAAIAKATGADQ